MEQILEEMWRLRDDVKASQEEAALQVARSSRCDPYTFKRKGNENQHAFNDDVEDKLVQVQAHLDRMEARAEGTSSANALAKAWLHGETIIHMNSRTDSCFLDPTS